MKVLSEAPLNMAQVKEELEKIKKRDKELNFRANKTEEYLNQFVPKKKTTDLIKKLEKLNIPRLRDLHINKIVDIMPTNVNDLKMLLSGYTVTINNESMKKIINAINDFLGSDK